MDGCRLFEIIRKEHDLSPTQFAKALIGARIGDKLLRDLSLHDVAELHCACETAAAAACTIALMPALIRRHLLATAAATAACAGMPTAAIGAVERAIVVTPNAMPLEATIIDWMPRVPYIHGEIVWWGRSSTLHPGVGQMMSAEGASREERLHQFWGQGRRYLPGTVSFAGADPGI